MMAHKVTFLPAEITVEVDETDYPLSREGLPGSLLDIATAHDVPIEHACGGVGVCATCHVVVVDGADNLSPAEDEEFDHLEQAPGTTLHSRLACRAVVGGDVTVTIPAWNRNAVSEQPQED